MARDANYMRHCVITLLEKCSSQHHCITYFTQSERALSPASDKTFSAKAVFNILRDRARCAWKWINCTLVRWNARLKKSNFRSYIWYRHLTETLLTGTFDVRNDLAAMEINAILVAVFSSFHNYGKNKLMYLRVYLLHRTNKNKVSYFVDKIGWRTIYLWKVLKDIFKKGYTMYRI